MTFTLGTLAKMGLELTLGVCIKLFCDNGRVHWRDFANDYLFWMPGVEVRAGDGVGRLAAERCAPVAGATVEERPVRLAA